MSEFHLNDFLELAQLDAPPVPSGHAEVDRLYISEAGVLRQLQSDGTDEPVGGGGSTADQFSGVGSPVIANQSYTVTLNGSPDGGTFTLEEPDIFVSSTGGIAFDADGDAVTEAFDSGFEPGVVLATGPAGGPWTITFIGPDCVGQPVTLTLDTNDLTNGGDPVADPTIEVAQEGGEPFSAAADAIYQDTLAHVAYFNEGDEDTPDWQPMTSTTQGDYGGVGTAEDGMTELLGWDSLNSDTDLLDRTDPFNPVFLAAGTYMVQAAVQTTALFTEGGNAQVILSFGTANGDAMFSNCGSQPGAGGPTCVSSVQAGDPLSLLVTNGDGAAARNFTFAATVVKLA